MRLFAKVLQLRMQWLFSKATDTAAAISMGTVAVLYGYEGGPCVHANWFLPFESLIDVWGRKSEMSDFWPKRHGYASVTVRFHSCNLPNGSLSIKPRWKWHE